jgi:GxxExxY protein
MFKADLFIENCIVVELKTVQDFSPIHIAKTLNYMNLIKAPKGILYNFNVTNLYAEGQKTLVNKYYEEII